MVSKKTETKKHLSGKHILEWIAPEYVKHERGPAWMTIAALIAAALIAYAMLNQEWTMAIVFFVISVVYYIHNRQEPKDIKIGVSELGVHIGPRTYLFSHLRSFWIIYDPPFVKTLHIKFVKKHQADIVIQLHDQEPVPVRNLLLKHIPEMEGKEEAPMDAIIRALKL